MTTYMTSPLAFCKLYAIPILVWGELSKQWMHVIFITFAGFLSSPENKWRISVGNLKVYFNSTAFLFTAAYLLFSKYNA